MRYLASLSLFVMLAAVPAFAAPSTEAVPFPSAVSPLKGAVTVVEPNGEFFTDLGAIDQLPRGEMLTVYHNGLAVAQAQVVKVNRLDSIAQLEKAYRSLVLEPGDLVVVQTNQTAPATPGSLNVVAPPQHIPFWVRMTEMEPNMSMGLDLL